MEGSAAAGAAAAPAGDATNAEAGAATEGGPDLAAMAQQLTDMQTSQDGLHEMLQNLATAGPQAGQEAGAQDGETDGAETPFDFSFLDNEAEMDPAVLATNLSAVMDKAAEAKAKEMVGPVQQQVAEMQRDQQIQALLGEFPELQEENVAKTVFDTATSYAEAVGHPEHAAEPWFLRTVYLMGRAVDQANQEDGEGPSVAHLEGAGGAGPGGGGQVNLADSIIGAGAKRNGGLPFG